jgi:hypothetical protein
MSNLSDLLPAGAGAKSATFTADGTLSSGQTVVLQSDGTVKAISSNEFSQTLGSEVVFESASSTKIAAAYDANAQKTVIAYRDGGNSDYGTAVVATVSGTTISFGTPVVYYSGEVNGVSIIYDESAQKVVIAFRISANNYGYACVGTVSGTSISFGSVYNYTTHTINAETALAYDSANSKFLVSYSDSSSSSYGKARVGTVSGTVISYGTAATFESAHTSELSSDYDANAGAVVISYKDLGNSAYGTSIVGTISGTSVSFGTAVVFESATTQYTSTRYDSSEKKIVVSYQDGGNTNRGTSIVGTVSGTSISFGTATVFETGGTLWIGSAYDSNAGKMVITFQDSGDSNKGKLVVATVSGTSISFGTAVEFNSGSTLFTSAAFDSDQNKIVIGYSDYGNSEYGTGIVFQNESSNYLDFVGITDEAIADTATGAVVVEGGVTEKVSGLTTGSTYYVQDDGTLSTTTSSVTAGKALSATKLLLNG